jgi:hypothetical protein
MPNGWQEYAVTLNLSLSPYATRGRLPELNSYLAEMLSDPDDSFLRYLTILDEHGRPSSPWASATCRCRRS